MRAPFALLLVACGETPPPAAPAAAPPPAPVELSPVERAVRVSMALRGVRPTFEELDAVAVDADALPGLVDGWLSDPDFGATVRDIANEALQMRADSQVYDATGTLTGFSIVGLGYEIQEAPLRLVEEVVLEDRPYREIVTADYTVANEMVSLAWTGLEPFDLLGPERQDLHWTDGRPAAGILSDSALWVRWRSAGANAQRGRANLVARALLCEDFLARDATIDASAVADPSGGTSLDSPGCAGCHKTLDPLASFFPFIEYPASSFFVFPIDLFDEAYEPKQGWTATTGVAPNYWGLGGGDFAQFAQYIADDPRFHRCAARRFWSFLHQEPSVPVDVLDELQAELDATESAKTVIRGIVLDPGFAQVDAAAPHLMRLRAEALPRMIEDLTGFVWKASGEGICCETVNGRLGAVPLGEDGYRGWVVLWGGIDGPYLAQPTHASSTTSALILEEYAQLAAQHVVDADFAEVYYPEDRLLLRWVEPDTVDEAAVRVQLSRLHLRILGEEVAPDDADDAYALFASALAASGDPARAWVVVLAAMLSDDRVEYY